MTNFLTYSRSADLNSVSVSEICDAIRQELEKSEPIKYINTILTAHVVKTPPDYESALGHLHRLHGMWTAR